MTTAGKAIEITFSEPSFAIQSFAPLEVALFPLRRFLEHRTETFCPLKSFINAYALICVAYRWKVYLDFVESSNEYIDVLPIELIFPAPAVSCNNDREIFALDNLLGS